MLSIIYISGKAQHGKDTTAKLLKSALECSNKKVLITHYGDLLKYICKAFFNWNGEKDEAGRTLLQFVGTDKIRAHNPNYWIDFIENILEIFKDEWDYVIIPDARFPNEIEQMKQKFQTTSVRVERTNFTSSLTEEQQHHISETALDDYIFDYIIANDGEYDDLEEQCKWLAHQIIHNI